MKLSDLFETAELPEDAPMVLTIMNNLLKKDIEVRVYYRGDGGRIDSLTWDPTTGSAFMIRNSWLKAIKVTDDQLEKMKLFQSKRSSFSNRDMFTLRVPQVDEATGDARQARMDWINSVDAEFKALIKEAGWRQNREPKPALENATFGGTIYAPKSAQNGVLPMHVQREMVTKLIIKKLLDYAKQGHLVSATPYSISAMARRYLTADDTVDDVIEMLKDQGEVISMDGNKFEMYWSISIPKDLNDAYEAEFVYAAKAFK